VAFRRMGMGTETRPGTRAAVRDLHPVPGSVAIPYRAVRHAAVLALVEGSLEDTGARFFPVGWIERPIERHKQLPVLYGCTKSQQWPQGDCTNRG
jgi:hypothetical protein